MDPRCRLVRGAQQTAAPVLPEPSAEKAYHDDMLEVFLFHAQAVITEHGGHVDMAALWPEAIRRARERDGVIIKPQSAKQYLAFLRVHPGGAA